MGWSTRQRWAAVVAVVVGLWALASVFMPFRPAYFRTGCGAPITEAWRPNGRATVGARVTFAGAVPPCRQPARRKLWRAGVLVGVAVVGGVVVVRLLRERRPLDATTPPG